MNSNRIKLRKLHKQFSKRLNKLLIVNCSGDRVYLYIELVDICFVVSFGNVEIKINTVQLNQTEGRQLQELCQI